MNRKKEESNMKKLISLALIAVLALCCAALPAMAESHPLIYKVTDADGHYIYLLGTMHVATAETFPIAPLDEIMGQVDRVIFEVGEADMEAIGSGAAGGQEAAISEQMFVQDSGLSDAGAQMISEFMTEVMNNPVEPETLKVMPLPMLAQLVQMQIMTALGYDVSGHGVDLYVFSEAKKHGLEISGVETMADQAKAVEAEAANLSADPAAVEQKIAEMIGNMEKLGSEMETLVKAYNTGDKDTLYRIFSAEAARSSVDGARNARFAQAAQQALNDGGRALIAIGSYHIIADDGLVNALTQAGCTVTPVK